MNIVRFHQHGSVPNLKQLQQANDEGGVGRSFALKRADEKELSSRQQRPRRNETRWMKTYISHRLKDLNDPIE